MNSVLREIERHLRPAQMLAAGLIVLMANPARADSATWAAPDFDLWSYQFNTDPGIRGTGPTFRGEFALDGNQFVPETAADPARRSSNIIAFDTSSDISPGLPATSYEIELVTMTLKLRNSSFGTEPIQYSETPETPVAALTEAMGGSWSVARPIELFGVGLTQGYTDFDFGPNDPEDLLLSEGDFPYTAAGYIAYPLAGNSSDPGQYVDVSNNITGGYSATAVGNTASPFDAAPWAIGKVPGLVHGDPVANNTIFTFEINLAEVGVEQYLQESLANGSLAFAVSSLHAASQPGTGGFSEYPQWFLKEAVGHNIGGAEAATLQIDYSIIEQNQPGDFDSDEDVDGRDFLIWQRGGSNSFLGADDLSDWQLHYGTNSTATTLDTSTPSFMVSVPEPTSLMLVIFGVIMNLTSRMPLTGERQ
ncbi:hypothetical protein [Bythopirellula goksoeyrii]|uniref:PEP-CTERM protein-sorting domain-containing protein n=1 Tax=Bythopirellula goksoeyrii TaxID=1400387 RepID=A0A5B9QHX9_9BACT|nr:hypothetical protein [Bythopirellula goksoeyrii]QEG33733.1 hypothetical protein Pr1d_09980 [Bythopirellula goksoeyrii]